VSARVREAGKHIAHLNEKAVPYVPPHVQSLCFGVQKVVNLRESVRNKLFSEHYDGHWINARVHCKFRSTTLEL
jgi:hypothetical protein